METIKKKCNVVMLPTSEKAASNIIKLGNLIGIAKTFSSQKMENQHLYITSDEEIKEGDIYFSILISKVYTAPKGFIKSKINNPKTEYKVIASTDKSLGLPQPSQSFIEKYISEYNKVNIIKEVMVEYNMLIAHDNQGNKLIEYDLKISKDNTITISRVKDSWNKEEVIEFGLKCVNLGMDLKNNPLPRLNEISGKEYYYNWTKDNL